MVSKITRKILVSQAQTHFKTSTTPATQVQEFTKPLGLLNNDQAADYIGITPGTLEVWRSTKRQIIPYIKVGRLVKYRPSALDDFLTAQTVDGSSTFGSQA